jgi:hypothetical protein
VNEQVQSVYSCSEDSWTRIPMPVSTSADGALCAEQERLLRTDYPKLTAYPAVLRAKGNGNVTVDLEGIHWTWQDKNPATLELRIALMDGESVLANREFLFGKRTFVERPTHVR